MSQTVRPIADIINTAGYTPTPCWEHLDHDGFLDNVSITDPGGGTELTVQLALVQPPQAGVHTLSVGLSLDVFAGYFGTVDCIATLSGDTGTIGSWTLFSATGFIGDITAQTFTVTLSAEETEQLIIQLCNTDGQATGNVYCTIQAGATGPPGATFNLFYIKFDTPDAFVYQCDPNCGPKAGGTAITLTARGVGALALDPADLRLQFSTDYNEVTPTVVDDDHITCVTPANSLDTPADPIPGPNLPLLFLYDVSNPTRSMSLSKIPPDYLENLWTYSETCGGADIEYTGSGGLTIPADEGFGATVSLYQTTIPGPGGGPGSGSGFCLLPSAPGTGNAGEAGCVTSQAPGSDSGGSVGCKVEL